MVELIKGKGSQFDPQIIDLVVPILSPQLSKRLLL